MMQRSASATFTRGAKRIELDVRRAYTTKQFGRMFGLEPNSVYLNGDTLDGIVYLPDDEGRFDFPHMSPAPAEFDTVTVEGTPIVNSSLPATGDHRDTPSNRPAEPVAQPPNSGNSSSSQATLTATRYPGFQSVVRQTPAKKAAPFSLKVTRAHLTHFEGDRPIFSKIGQTYVEISEANANLPYISAAVKQEWGEEYVIVTPKDGLPVPDSSGTQGFKFWKVNSRKFHAVPEDDLLAPVRKRRRRQSQQAESSTASDCGCSCKTSADDLAELTEEVTTLAGQQQQMMDKLSGAADKLDAVLKLTKDTPVPLGLKRLLQETLKCRICHSAPMKPPILFAKCCKVVLGCESCITTWFQGPEAFTKPCPHCQAPRAFTETLRVHGMDDLLTELSTVIGED